MGAPFNPEINDIMYLPVSLNTNVGRDIRWRLAGETKRLLGMDGMDDMNYGQPEHESIY